ncbi:MAG: hypothetical protein LBV75_08060 [Paludibacter sp.]|jgi:hypothetical protein|nr:hypothetical protein [Paludibacter sp.]
MAKSVLLDTSFFIRFLNKNDLLFQNADNYFRYFIENNIEMLISTISIAEFCIVGSIDELPLKNLQIVPFNLIHAQKTGLFAKIVFQNKNKLKLNERNIIPNDTKLFAQADIRTDYYLSSDTESLKIYNLLKKETGINFQFIDLQTPVNETFSLLF